MKAQDRSGVRVVLAGGGTAGHVLPLLATGDALRRRVPDADIRVLGTAEGLEARLVPERGYPLVVVPKVPFPRRPDARALRFPGALRRAVATAAGAIRDSDAQVVVGFGGYVATPAYLAARRAGVPIVLHEQNARPGLANRLGARFTARVATTFASTELPHAVRVGLPLREEIRTLDREALAGAARAEFGLDEGRPTLLVFGGSLGAQRLNEAVAGAGAELLAAGVQVLHLTGAGKEVAVPGPDPRTGARYLALPYTDRMDLAYAVADLALCRAGAGTVCELAAVGLPAVYVPLPIGNGEQRLNAREVVEAGGGLLVEDAQVDPGWVRTVALPLLQDGPRLQVMAAAAAEHGDRDAADRLVDLILEAAGGQR
ncbi:undecaprenyldiphospho-muramoylpentapeptide beta-N-acetylglucosaminyltransferase [uncultured Serinicoccus sp.]|uniref:undecaprenyldiphospho-muramoylpentapeptide beta-N-acetylglucosaminyltransferase n=1 Tax=uncultured Serinicoccus sp. TaxID=735514 RepID=UPI0026195E99|nr:undecaprenyldiphospho-muramoylpentapeptide beta-N-acetylglucosaminyltransferase [uncultured Serinicoccus sp.]